MMHVVIKIGDFWNQSEFIFKIKEATFQRLAGKFMDIIHKKKLLKSG